MSSWLVEVGKVDTLSGKTCARSGRLREFSTGGHHEGRQHGSVVPLAVFASTNRALGGGSSYSTLFVKGYRWQHEAFASKVLKYRCQSTAGIGVRQRETPSIHLLRAKEVLTDVEISLELGSGPNAGVPADVTSLLR